MWWTGTVQCRVCQHRHVSVIGEDGPVWPASDENQEGFSLDDQECPNCNCMACDPVDGEVEFT